LFYLLDKELTLQALILQSFVYLVKKQVSSNHCQLSA